jgi:hypothetical protein
VVSVVTLLHGFESRLSAMSDRELLEMIAHGSDYLPEALAAANRELQRRRIDPSIASEVEAQLQDEFAITKARADRPLPWIWRLIFFLFPIGLVQLLIADRYGNKGFVRCRRECWSWTERGLLFYILSILAFGAIDHFWSLRDREWVCSVIMLATAALVVAAPMAMARRRNSAQRPAA